MSKRQAYIRGITSHFPDRTLTNKELVTSGGTLDDDKIFRKTGIRERRIAGDDECVSDLGVAAARKLFETQECSSDDVDFVICCTQTPDYFLPATACLIQDGLDLSTSCGALDIGIGCAGFVYGLAVAKGMIEREMANTVLLITADTYTKFIHPTDLSVRSIFGDGAAATLISGIELDYEPIGPFVFGSNGKGADNLIVPAGGMRRNIHPEACQAVEVAPGVFRSPRNLFMNGPEVFSFSTRTVPTLVRQLLKKSNMEIEEVDYFVFHQASLLILEALRKKLEIPNGKFCVNLERTGNTVSATLPMALEASLERGLIQPGCKIVLVGFGVGYSWGANVVRWI